MHTIPPKNILYNVILLAHLNTLDCYLSLSDVLICDIFRWVTYKCSGLCHIIQVFHVPVIVKYSNTNLQVHIIPPKNIIYNVILLTQFETLDVYPSLTCVLICVIFRWLTYKCSGLLLHYTTFSCSSIAGPYTHVQLYQNAMSIILPLKSCFFELKLL